MDYTQHYNLKKPAYGEAVDVKDLNDNADITDAQLNTLAGLVAARLLKTDLTNQIINDATKVASAATVYSVNKKADDINSDLGDKAGLISFSHAGGNTETDIINALYQNWSKFPVGSSVIKFNNNVEVWTGIVNKYDAAKGSALIQAASTGFIKKYIHNGTQLYSLIATDEIIFDGVGKVVFAQNSTATSIRFYTTAVNYLYIEFLTATKNIKFGFYNGSTWTDYWIM